MIATKQMDLRANIKKYFDLAFNGEPIIASREQLKQGKTISFSIEELEEMEADDWKPTVKVLEFMEKMKDE